MENTENEIEVKASAAPVCSDCRDPSMIEGAGPDDDVMNLPRPTCNRRASTVMDLWGIAPEVEHGRPIEEPRETQARDNVVRKAVALVTFWEEIGGNGVMGRAKEDALILAVKSLPNDKAEVRL
jgi:hypothetical protein